MHLRDVVKHLLSFKRFTNDCLSTTFKNQEIELILKKSESRSRMSLLRLFKCVIIESVYRSLS